jgi:hypothetical protein
VEHAALPETFSAELRLFPKSALLVALLLAGCSGEQFTLTDDFNGKWGMPKLAAMTHMPLCHPEAGYAVFGEKGLVLQFKTGPEKAFEDVSYSRSESQFLVNGTINEKPAIRLLFDIDGEKLNLVDMSGPLIDMVMDSKAERKFKFVLQGLVRCSTAAPNA